MNPFAKNNKVASVDTVDQKALEKKKRNDKRNPEKTSIDGNAYNPIFIVAPKRESVIQIGEKEANLVGEKQRGLLSIFGIADNHWKRIQKIWKATRRRRPADRMFQNVNLNEVAQAFCDNTFRKEDILVVSGVIQIIIGIGTLLAGSVAYLEKVCSIEANLFRRIFFKKEIINFKNYHFF